MRFTVIASFCCIIMPLTTATMAKPPVTTLPRSNAPEPAVRPGAGADQQDPLTPESPTDKRLASLRSDLRVVAETLAKTDHGFRGYVDVPSEERKRGTNKRQAFRGGQRGALRWFTIEDWRVVELGTRSIASRAEGEWTDANVHAPDLPLSPALFVPLLSEAELDKPTPSQHRNRPALRVHARWRGEAAKRVLLQTAADPMGSRIIEGCATAIAKNDPRWSLDATVLYDPATKTFSAATLRLALLGKERVKEDDERPAAPEGLPVFDTTPTLEIWWHIECPPGDAPSPPELDDEARQMLGDVK